MIIFANRSIVPVLLSSPDKYFILNLYSPVGLGTNLNNLFPPRELLQIAQYDTPEFDQLYVNYVLNNKLAFIDFMEIIMAYYYNNDVVVLTDYNYDITETLADCIIKIIQQRYGYNCTIIKEIEDLYFAKEDDQDFSETGWKTFLADKEWYVMNTVDAKKLIKSLEDGVSDGCDSHI